MKETRNFYAVHCRSHLKLSRWKRLTIMAEPSAASSRRRLEAQYSTSGLKLRCTNWGPLDDSSATLPTRSSPGKPYRRSPSLYGLPTGLAMDATVELGSC